MMIVFEDFQDNTLDLGKWSAKAEQLTNLSSEVKVVGAKRGFDLKQAVVVGT